MADTLDNLAQEEHENSLVKKKELIDAYNRDALGSYDTAQKRAYDNALPSNPILSTRLDYKFIQKVRSIAENEFKNQQNKEQAELFTKYNLNKPPNGPIGSFVDMPVRILDALGRDLGIKAGESRNLFASGTTSLLGSDGSLMPALDTAERYVNAAIDDVTRIVTESPWIEKRIKSLRDKANEPLPLSKVNSFMDGMNTVFSKNFRRIMGDMADILNEWWHDPRTLCCLIKTLSALAIASGKKLQQQTGIEDIKIFGKTVHIGNIQNESFGTTYNKMLKKYFSGDAKFSELSGTREFFDKMIAILKIIQTFLNQDLNFNFALNLDLGLAMSKASIGALMALLSALQQMLEDKIYSKMMEFVKTYVREEIRQCLPFERLLRLLADWMTGPDGVFKYIEQFVDSYMIGFQTNTQYGFDQSAKMKLMDSAALNKLIKLLEKMRDAMLNLELCIEADFNQTPQPSDDGATNERSVGFGPTNYGELADEIQQPAVVNNKVVYPTDTEIKAFLVNRLGESEAFANQVLESARAGADANVGRAAGSPDNAGGGDPTADLRMAIGDCARTLNSTRIEELAKLVADWEII